MLGTSSTLDSPVSHTKLVVRDHGWGEMFRRVQEIKHSRVRVGVLSEGRGAQKHPPGKLQRGKKLEDVLERVRQRRRNAKQAESGLTLAELATILHFGTENGHIPARPFLTLAFDKHRDELVEMGGKLIGGILDGKMTVEKALNILGASLANFAKREITDGSGVPPPNAPSTVRRKGSDRPLVDTGRLLGAINWSVEIRSKGK